MHQRWTLIVLAAAGLALAACASPEEQRQADAKACQSYGFTPGTTAFANCMQREQIARSQSSGFFPSIGLGVGGGSFGGGGFGGGGIGLGF